MVAEQSGQPALIRTLRAIVAGSHRQSLAAMRLLDQVSRTRRPSPVRGEFLLAVTTN
jgi:hypothetical protein